MLNAQYSTLMVMLTLKRLKIPNSLASAASKMDQPAVTELPGKKPQPSKRL